jgi:carbamoyltransferase
MKILPRGVYRGMAQGGLYQMNRRAPVQGMGGVGMAQPMRGHRGLDTGPFRGGLDDSFHLGRVQVALALATGEVKMAIAEERVIRRKRAGGFKNSLGYALKKLNLTENDIDIIVYSSCCENIRNAHFINGRERVRSAACNHHLSHALSVYLTSSFNKAIILVMDAGGQVLDEGAGSEWWRSRREQHSYFIARDDEIYLINGDFEEPETAGIGEVYRAFTHYLGWDSSRYANKTMALSAYGNRERFKNKRIFYFDDNGKMLSYMVNNPSDPINMVKEILVKYNINISFRKPQEKILEDHRDLAAWLQAETENAIYQKVRYLVDETGINNVCFSGGVAYNCSAMGQLFQCAPKWNIYIHPASGDHGQCLGNAIYGHLLENKNWKRSVIFNPYLGGDEEITLVKIKQLTENYRKSLLIFETANITEVVAELIEKGEIVAWFQGRSEYGPRALGNRSILADPRILANKQRINSLKGRECFMPFAPRVLAECANDYFQCKESPYMTTAFKVILDNKDKIPAVVHYDDTARIQTVGKENNFMFYDLIYKFYLRTKVPLVLNTSFNGYGEPIVETLKDALKTFMKLDIKFLAAGQFLIEKVNYES